MHKFQFRLQFLLDMRNREEKNLKNELYAAKMQLSLQEQQLLALKSQVSLEHQQLQKLSMEGITVLRMQAYYAHIGKLKEAIVTQQFRIKMATQQCD